MYVTILSDAPCHNMKPLACSEHGQDGFALVFLGTSRLVFARAGARVGKQHM